MSITRRIINAFRRREGLHRRPRPGLMSRPQALDRWGDDPAEGLTPARLLNILRDADAGSIDRAMALFEQMEEKDAHLYSVANTRRRAVTGLPWQVISAAELHEGVERPAADETAAFCREVLARIEGLDEVLQHLSLALGRNIAVAENVWDFARGELTLVDIAPVAFDRLCCDRLGRVRIRTARQPVEGIAPPPDKFVVHAPHAASGHPMRGGLLRVSALAYLGKHFAIKDWMVFSEVYGMPVRIARYEPTATTEEKRELLRMLQTMGSDAAAVFSKAVEVQFLEAGRGRGQPPYEAICTFFNRELSKAWLGQTLTVETAGETGTFAAAQIHNEVRLDLRQDDIAREGRTVRRDILTPLVRFQFGPQAPVPYFRRQLEPPRELTRLARVLGVAVNDLGLRVPARWVHDALGVPMALPGEAVLTGKRS